MTENRKSPPQKGWAEDIEKMTTIEMAINEAMRLIAPVPAVLRTVNNDFSLNSGVVVPKGTQIVLDIFNMQRRTQVWGEEALKFNPELHFGPGANYHQYAFIPFTKGLRMCIGYRYAYNLMTIIIAKLFRNFELKTSAKLEDLEVKGTISIKLVEYPEITIRARQ